MLEYHLTCKDVADNAQVASFNEASICYNGEQHSTCDVCEGEPWQKIDCLLQGGVPICCEIDLENIIRRKS